MYNKFIIYCIFLYIPIIFEFSFYKFYLIVYMRKKTYAIV